VATQRSANQAGPSWEPSSTTARRRARGRSRRGTARRRSPSVEVDRPGRCRGNLQRHPHSSPVFFARSRCTATEARRAQEGCSRMRGGVCASGGQRYSPGQGPWSSSPRASGKRVTSCCACRDRRLGTACASFTEDDAAVAGALADVTAAHRERLHEGTVLVASTALTRRADRQPGQRRADAARRMLGHARCRARSRF
jgi:hypothetical protein